MPPLDAADLSNSDHLLERLSVERCTDGAVLRLMDSQGVSEVQLPPEVLVVLRHVIETMSKGLAVSFERLSSLTGFDATAKVAGVSEDFIAKGIKAGRIKCEEIAGKSYIRLPSVLRLKGQDDSLFLPPERGPVISEHVHDLLDKKERPLGTALLVAGQGLPLPPEVLDATRFIAKVLLSGEALRHSTMPLEITEEQAVWVTRSHIAFVKDELEAGRIEFKELNGQCLVDLRSALARKSEVSAEEKRAFRELFEIQAEIEASLQPQAKTPIVD